ncbi:uncharacterized protein O3C94_018465 [Discoglossus pictus]
MSLKPDLESMREKVKGYKPGETLQNIPGGIESVNLQLYGLLGHGKTSLINSCIYVLKNQGYQNVAGAGKSDGGLTVTRKKYKLTGSMDIVDNRGFNSFQEREILEVSAQLRSLRDFEEVDWNKDNLKLTLRKFKEKYNEQCTYFTVPVFVYSATSTMHKGLFDEIMTFITKAFDITGIHPIIVITNSANQNTDDIVKQFGNMGAVHRIALENYTENNHKRNPDTDNNILSFLNKCIDEAERGIEKKMEEIQDPGKNFINVGVKQIEEETKLLRGELEEEQRKTAQLEDFLKKDKCITM